MTQLILPGVDLNAFDHLAAYGIAAIVQAAGISSPRVAWTDELDPRPTLDGTDWESIGAAVHARAIALADPGSWVQADGAIAGTRTGLFSPRVKGMQRDEITAWYSRRHEALDRVGDTPSAMLDLDLIGALGEPSYWSFDRGEPRPDYGASRWEMKTRNRGEEFISNRFRLLTAAVAARTTEQIVAGLRGDTVVDEVGKNRPDSRTPTGLMPPGPADNARAWCALWGISLFPVIHSRAGASRTAGHLGHHGTGSLYLPLMTRPWPIARLRSVLVSVQLRTAASAKPASERTAVTRGEREVAWAWLTARGTSAVLRFPVFKSANASAPEKWAERGQRILPGTTR